MASPISYAEMARRPVKNSIKQLPNTAAETKKRPTVPGHQSKNTPVLKGLQGLPVEIHQQIAQNVDPNDLIALRLVSRDIEFKTRDPYFQSCVVERGVLIDSENCLRSALQVAKSERFGPHMRKLYFFVDEVPGLEADNPRRHDVFIIGGRRLDLLRALFVALKKNGACPEIVLTDLAGTTKRPLLSAKYDLDKLPQVGYYNASQAFRAVIRALSMARLEVPIFKTTFGRHYFSLETDLGFMLKDYSAVFENLRHLELKFTAHFGEVHKFCRLFPRFTKLETLYIHLKRTIDENWATPSPTLNNYGAVVRGMQWACYHKAIAYERVSGGGMVLCWSGEEPPMELDVGGYLFENERGGKCLIDFDGERRGEGESGEDVIARWTRDVERMERLEG